MGGHPQNPPCRLQFSRMETFVSYRFIDVVITSDCTASPFKPIVTILNSPSCPRRASSSSLYHRSRRDPVRLTSSYGSVCGCWWNPAYRSLRRSPVRVTFHFRNRAREEEPVLPQILIHRLTVVIVGTHGHTCFPFAKRACHAFAAVTPDFVHAFPGRASHFFENRSQVFVRILVRRTWRTAR